MPSGQFVSTPGAMPQETASFTYPTFPDQTLDYTQFALGSLQMTPTQLQNRIFQPGHGGSGTARPGYTGAYIGILNMTDACWKVTFQHPDTPAGGTFGGWVPPNYAKPIPIPLDTKVALLHAQWVNPIQAAPAEQLMVVFYDQADVAAGHVIQEGPIGPSCGQGLPQPGYYNAQLYGTNATRLDNDVPINAAIAAAVANGGGVVLLPAYLLKTSGTINLRQNVTIQGAGWQTVILPQTGAQYDAFATTQVNVGTNLRDCWVRDLIVDCSLMTGTQAGTGNAFHFCGAVNSGCVRTRVRHCPNYAYIAEGGVGGAFNCYFLDNESDTDCAGGLLLWGGCEANFVERNEFTGCAGAGGLAAPQPTFGTQITEGATLYSQTGVNHIIGNVFGNGGITTQWAVHIINTMNKIIGNKFDGNTYQAMRLDGSHHMVLGNEFNHSSSVGSVPAIQLGGSFMHIVGNDFHPSGGGASTYTYAIQEAGGPFTDSVIADNHFDAGTVGVLNFNAASTHYVHHNSGYNPIGSQTPPAVPASGTPLTNPFNVDVAVSIATLGTLTAVALGGTTRTDAPAVGSTYRLPAKQTITLTYAGAAPTWQWYGD